MKLLKNKYWLPVLLLLALTNKMIAQDSLAHELILNISFYMPNDKIPYLKVSAKEKVERKFIPQKGITGHVYIGEETGTGLLGKVNTDDKGEAILYIPSSFKSIWDSSSTVTFLVNTEANKVFQATRSEVQVTKSRIEIDTISDGVTKSIIAKVTALNNDEWLPAKDVELKIAVKRSLSDLPVGDEETYTTDSTGTVTAEFKRDSLLGDTKGNLILVAKTEDHETYGNISVEKHVNWGVAPKFENLLDRRTLWARSSKTPFWLLGLAYSIIGGVWGTLIYLIFLLTRIRKLNKASG